VGEDIATNSATAAAALVNGVVMPEVIADWMPELNST
jgi:hypothetical protein